MKSAYFATLAVMISLVSAQPSVMRDQDCKNNEEFQTCGSACEPSCDNPNPSFCTLQCVVGCQCEKGFVRNSKKECVKLEECNVVPTTNSPASVPPSSVKCAANETYSDCHNSCSEKKCPVKFAPAIMCMALCQQACGCSAGFARNITGFCIKEADCPKIASNGTSLNGTLISPVMPFPPHSNLSLPLPNFNGTVSNSSIPLPTVIPFPVHSNLSVPVSAPPLPMLNGSIFPPTPINANIGITAPPVIHVANGCQNVTCPVGEKCEQAKLECKAPPCNWVSCVPLNPSLNSTVTDGCSVVKCEVGETCQQTKVQCFAPPCPEQISCVKYVDGSDPIDYSGDYDYQVDPIEGFLHNGTHNEHGHGDWTTGGLDPAFNGTGLPPVANGRCDVNETLSTCYNKCVEKKCPGIEKNMFCTKHCGIGCECKDGFLRSREGTCVAWDDCPEESQCEQNEEYRCEKCNPTCQDPDPHCNSKNCKKACKCAEGFVKLKGKCVTLDACPSHTHDNVTCLATEDYTDCTPKCHISCTGKELCDTKMAIAMCKKGCACRNKYKKDTSGACVHNRHCFRSTDCPENEEWAKCRDDEETCDGILFKTTKPPVHDSCYSGCACVSGFARKNGTCVAKDKC